MKVSIQFFLEINLTPRINLYELFNIYKIVFTLKARYDLNYVKSAITLQRSNQPTLEITL